MSSSSTDNSFRCPVCRARQEISERCRRCQADLQLVCRAHRAADELVQQLAHTEATGHFERRAAIIRELRLMAPNRLPMDSV